MGGFFNNADRVKSTANHREQRLAMESVGPETISQSIPLKLATSAESSSLQWIGKKTDG